MMLENLKKALDQDTKQEGKAPYYLLTIASVGDNEYLKHTDLKKAHEFLDFINIMTYDLYHGTLTKS